MTDLIIFVGTEWGEQVFSFTPLLDRSSQKPLFRQLYEYIKEQILEGNIQGGTRLPSLRKLAKDLNLSINTVENAYQQLGCEGYIESIPKVGYAVCDIKVKFRESAPKIEGERLEKAAAKYKYDLSTKCRDVSAIDLSVWKRIGNSVMNEELSGLLGYGEPQGELELREEIAKYVFETRGVFATPNQIIIGAGTQYCLSLLCQMLRPLYNDAAMEEPGSNWLRFIFERFKFNVTPVSYEQKGLNVNELENSGAKIVFVTPSHQMLRGTVMPVANRIELLNWAEDNDGIIIEDDYDSETKYLTNSIPALKSLDKGDHVVYLGSFSKIFIPSIRISYMILPNWLLDIYSEKFWLYENTVSKLHQLTLARFIKEGYWQKHIQKTKRYYAKKYRCIIGTLSMYFTDKVQIISVNSALSILLEVSTEKSEKELVELARQADIKIVPVSEYYIKHIEFVQSGSPRMLLSFKGIPIESIEPAVKLLSEVWFDK